MFTTQTRQKSGMSGLKKPCRVCGEGLGDNPITGITSSLTARDVLFPMSILNKPFEAVPVVGQILGPMNQMMDMATGLVLKIPVVGKIFGGLFKKATHYGDCMKWWVGASGDSNIRGMVRGISPYPVDVASNFPDESREYQLQHASSVMSDSNVQSILGASSRMYNIGTYFLRALRENPDLMDMSCMSQPNVQAETGQAVSASEVDGYMGQLKEQARQQEYQDVLLKVKNVLGMYRRSVERKAAVVQQTRQAATAFQLPTGVTSISKGGSLILTPGTSSNLVINRGVIGGSTIRKK
jgi:hypothetical protein